MVQSLNNTENENAELVAIRQRQLQLKRQKLELIKNHGLLFYKPHAKQDQFHRAGVQSKRRMVRAGNRFGKSHMGCAEDCAWLTGERPWYKLDDPARRGGIPPHPVKLLLITQDWDLANDVWVSQRGNEGKIWKFISPASIPKHGIRRNHSGCIDTIEVRREPHLGGGTSLFKIDTVKSWMSNPMGAESKDWDAIHVDEPCPEGMWKGAARGLMDRGGSAWFTLTPLSEFWINDYFFPQDTGGKLRDNVWAINGSTYDNPTLSPAAIAEFESTLTDDEKQCRLHGIPLHLTGLIYKEFSWATHVLTAPPTGWEAFELPPANYPIYAQIDPHPRTPHCVLLSTVLPDGRRVYFNDIFTHCPMPELAEEIRGKLHDRVLVSAEMDPLGFIPHVTTETSMADDLAMAGIYVEKATKALDRGILRVKHALKHNELLFCPSARRALWEIQRYCWDEDTNKPVDKDDHAMECLYRMEVMEPRWVDTKAQIPNTVKDLEFSRPEFDLETVSFDVV